MTDAPQAAAPGRSAQPVELLRPRYQYWLLPFAAGVAFALVTALWLFPRGDVLAAPTPTDRLEAQYLALRGDEQLLRAEIARLTALFAGQRLQCKPPERPIEQARRPPVEQDTKPPIENEPAPRAEPKPDEELTIPEDAPRSGDLSFLQGCWNNETGIFSQKTREPLNIEYCFDANGRGRSTIIERNGQRCSTASVARFDDAGKLVIEDLDNLRCGGGRYYYKHRANCTSTDGGRARCDGVQPEVGTRFNATIKRKAGAEAAPGGPGPDRGGRTRPGGGEMTRRGAPGGAERSDVPPAGDDLPPDDLPPPDDQPLPDDNADAPPPSDLPPVRGERTRPRR